MDQPHLGHKRPRPGLQRLYWCPSCLNLGSRVHLTSRHVFESCPAVEGVRKDLGITSFINSCLEAGRSRARAYKNFLLGLDGRNNKVEPKDYLERGASLKELTDAWLESWGQADD